MSPGELLSRYRFRRTIRPGDASRVRRLVRSTGFFSPEETVLAAELVQERLRLGPASGYHFVFAQRGPTLAGYACFGPIPCTARAYDLYWIAASTPEQGRGLGRMLVKRVEEAVFAMGGRRLYADTSSRDQYAPTRAFYEAMGFTADAVMRDFYADGEAKVVYAKTLVGERTRRAA